MDDLIPDYRKMASDGMNFFGLSVLQHADSIQTLLKRVGARTVLDFGCGRGDAYAGPHKIYKAWGLQREDITLYDPAFSTHDVLPKGRFDLVVCSDVLEHVPLIETGRFIKRLFDYGEKGVWASVCCRPAKKRFPDGRTNLHVTVRPYEWWLEQFREHSKGRPFTLIETL